MAESLPRNLRVGKSPGLHRRLGEGTLCAVSWLPGPEKGTGQTTKEQSMAEIKQGFVTVALADGVEVPAEAYTVTNEELNRKSKARRTVGATCDRTADDIERAAGRINVPGVTPDDLREAARRADAWEPIITDLEFLLDLAKKANRIDDGNAHDLLRRVVAELRARETFDPSIVGLAPGVIRYFSNQ
jgi:hypothetical protein